MATNVRGRRTVDTQSALHSLNILPMIVHVDGNLEEAAFLALLNEIPMAPTFNKKFSFYEDDWLPLTDTVDGAVSGTTATSIKVDTPLAFIAGQNWMNKRTGEVYHVTAVNESESTITVVREVGRNSSDSTGTAAAAINDADTLIRLGPSQGEHSNRQIAQSTAPAEVYNYSEKMRVDPRMTDVQRKTKHETGNDWPYQVDKAFKQFRKDLNGRLYISERNKTTINGENHWLFGGIDFFISTNILSVSGTLYEYAFDEWLVDEAMRYGPGEKTMFASSGLIRAVTEMTKDKVEISRATLGGPVENGIRVVSYMSPTGRLLNMVEDRFLTSALNGDGRVIDMSVVRMRHFSGDGVDGRPRLIPNTQDVDSDDFVSTIIADIGPEWGPEKHHGKITGATAGASGRATT